MKNGSTNNGSKMIKKEYQSINFNECLIDILVEL